MILFWAINTKKNNLQKKTLVPGTPMITKTIHQSKVDIVGFV